MTEEIEQLLKRLIILDIFLGLFVHQIYLLLALFLIIILVIAPKAKITGPPACPNCSSRHYLVYNRGQKFKFSPKGFRFIRYTIYQNHCQSCDYQWKIMDLDDQNA